MENKSYLGSITKYRPLGFGSNADVYLAEYMNSMMVAYKEFWNTEYVRGIKDEIIKLSEFDGKDKFIFPEKFIYVKPSDELFKGYTMPLLENYNFLYEEYLDKLDYDKKVAILLKARNLVEELHKNYKILHADVAPWNFMYNAEKDHLVLTDFDTSISMKKDIKLNISHNTIVREYEKYNKIDENLDIYLFNLCCFAVLNNLDLYYVIDQIRKNNFGVIDNGKAKDIFNSYKDLSDVKSLKKEYVIDYL